MFSTSNVERWLFKNEATKHGLDQSQWGFMKNFMALNIIIFADMARKNKNVVSWNVRRASSP